MGALEPQQLEAAGLGRVGIEPYPNVLGTLPREYVRPDSLVPRAS